MLPIQTLLRRIRMRLHDTEIVAYEDEEIIDVINCGIRFIRRCIADIRPALLLSTSEGILKSGEKSIVLNKRPTKIVHVSAGDKIIKVEEKYYSAKIFHNYNRVWKNYDKLYTKEIITQYQEKALHQTELAYVIRQENDRIGEPKQFYLTGSQTLNFVPIPMRDTKYTILTVDDIEEVTINDISPINTEYDDFLVEYANIRLSIGNEYDISQENQLMSNIYNQIQRMLIPPPAGILTRPYWS